MHIHIHQREHSEHRSLVIAAVVTGVIFLAEVVGGFLSQSLALLSDAGHMLTDLAALLLSLISGLLARRPKDRLSPRFTYGYRRLEILAALANAVTLFVICAYILYAAVDRLLFAPVVVDVPLMMGIATIGLVANGVSAIVLRRAESLNVRSAYLHVLTDLLSSVAVILGGAVMGITGVYWIDPLLSILIAVLIIRTAFPILRHSFTVLLEAAPPDLPVEMLQQAIAKVPGVRSVHDTHIWELSERLPSVSAHIVVEDSADRDEVLQQVQRLLRERFQIHHATLQIESEQYAQQQQCFQCQFDKPVASRN